MRFFRRLLFLCFLAVLTACSEDAFVPQSEELINADGGSVDFVGFLEQSGFDLFAMQFQPVDFVGCLEQYVIDRIEMLLQPVDLVRRVKQYGIGDLGMLQEPVDFVGCL